MSIQNHTIEQISAAFQAKRKFFDDGHTRTYEFRRKSLLALKAKIVQLKDEISVALDADLKKPNFEAYVGEIGVTIDDINHTLKNLKSWMKDTKVGTPLTIQLASSKIMHEPQGVVMIFSPWNYPFNLSMIPLIGAVAAGNCVIVKPAHETPNTCRIIEKIIMETFDPSHVSVVLGEGKTMGELLLNNFTFNHIFFTGSPKTGKWIMSKAAETLTPVTLELGGKSPAIVDKSANLSVAINRLVWAKYFNCGQTCISPDYILVHEDLKSSFIEGVKLKIVEYFGNDPKDSPFYARLINETRFEKVKSYLTQGEIVHGGRTQLDQKYIEPTVILVDNLDLAIMNEEIFGPIMPVIFWSKKEELIPLIRRNRYPLTCYVFSEDPLLVDYVMTNIEFGSGCINDAMAQFANSNFPFGGVMTSGTGKYHGKYSFEAFSNSKPILKTSTFIDIDMRYPPYTEKNAKIAKWFME